MRQRILSIAGLMLVAATATALCLRPMARAHASGEVTTDVKPQAATAGGFAVKDGEDFTGCGWALQDGSHTAVAQAASHAIPAGAPAPGLTIVYYSPQLPASQVLAALRKTGVAGGRIFGETTHGGILMPDGYHASPQGVVGVLALRNVNTRVGIGGANFALHPPREAAELAYRRAVADAAAPGRTPKLILLAVTLPYEEEVLAGLHAIAPGADVRLVGGTAAGSVDEISRRKLSNWSILADDRVIQNGVAIALLFAPEPFAGSYGGGYRRTTVGGVITKAQGRLIFEIDHRPALDVYDQWLGGAVAETRRRGQDVVAYCTFYPLCRIAGHYTQFIRAWPADDPDHPGALRTGGNVTTGETLFLSEGTWDLLLNHFASVPRLARESSPGLEPAAGLIIYCGGALPCIPLEERPQMSALVDLSLKHIPWIGVFTWGEQGSVSGAGYLHSSLTASTVLFPGAASAPAHPTAAVDPVKPDETESAEVNAP